jgi:hypothetical protein
MNNHTEISISQRSTCIHSNRKIEKKARSNKFLALKRTEFFLLRKIFGGLLLCLMQQKRIKARLKGIFMAFFASHRHHHHHDHQHSLFLFVFIPNCIFTRTQLKSRNENGNQF